MWALHARYRGRDTRRAELVGRFAEALSTLDGVGEFEKLGVEDIRANIDSATAACDVVMALLAAGDWAIGIGVVPGADTDDDAHLREMAVEAAGDALRPTARSGVVRVRISGARRDDVRAFNISAAFALLSQVLGKRSIEGREATSLVRSGLNQNEAAEELGISKQAMSQRLQAAGWHAEQAGWQLAVNLLAQAAQRHPA
ncbi:MarR family transcriptional regulator [Corynebacterium pacaense]|uniref:MarR family transcriptional regulator n=1 Tax=Corynebacterium pacaense TaxID=1816684 RepID=UPI0009B9E145|nr:MarR family transcriptional regulator [Corynebacterium pacaense]